MTRRKKANHGMSQATHPYKNLPSASFWSTTVENVHMFEISGWHDAKFTLEGARIASAGSCFAQHISEYLKSSGRCQYLDVEPPPPFLPGFLRKSYGYDLFSARYGNIYTAAGLEQLFLRAMGEFIPLVSSWPTQDGFRDPFRPTIEPHPFVSTEELEIQRNSHLIKTRDLFHSCDALVFTLGLTEAWRDRRDGAVFPLVPGSTRGGGIFDPGMHQFVNFSYDENLSCLIRFNERMLAINPDFKMILTVSPVPLAATATGENVVVASSYSKAVLRAVAGAMAHMCKNVDYFPSFEMIASHVMSGATYMPDKRHIAPFAVEMAMRNFILTYGLTESRVAKPSARASQQDLCDDEILLTFQTLSKLHKQRNENG